MIKINFIADEIAQKRNARVRKGAVMVYTVAWGITIISTLIQLQNNRFLIDTYKRQVNRCKAQIDEVSPQFKEAVELYIKRNKSKRKLSQVYASAVETQFILNCLADLTVKLPANFWLQEVHLSATDEGISTDIDKQGFSGGKTMTVTGNLFLIEKQDALQRFKSAIQQDGLFSLAECRLNLNEMSVKKYGRSYSHNFQMAFSWPEEIL